MNKQESLAIKITVSVCLCFLSVMVMVGLTATSINNRLREMEVDINEGLNRRTKMDSLYAEHLKECSFISRRDIGMDSRGYLYSKYKRNPNYVVEHTD